MPELPEVEHASRSLGEQIVGRRIVAVTKLDWERMVETHPADQFVALLAGRQVRAWRRRAKWILLELDDGWTLALHLRMSGHITVHGPEDTPDTYTHLVLQLDDGRQVRFQRAGLVLGQQRVERLDPGVRIAGEHGQGGFPQLGGKDRQIRHNKRIGLQMPVPRRYRVGRAPCARYDNARIQ